MSVTVLAKNGKLRAGDSVSSKNELYRAVMQDDGNFVVYKGDEVMWAAGTHGRGANRIVLHEYGNMTMYRADSRPCWSTRFPDDISNTCALLLTDEGKLVLEKDGQEVWNSDQPIDC